MRDSLQVGVSDTDRLETCDRTLEIVEPRTQASTGCGERGYELRPSLSRTCTQRGSYEPRSISRRQSRRSSSSASRAGIR